MIRSVQALNPLRLIPAVRRIPINPLTILFGLTITGLVLYTVYSLRQRVTPKAADSGKNPNLFREGETAFQSMNFTLAIEKYTAALNQTTDSNERVGISIRCSQAYSKLKQFQQALECCHAAFTDGLDSLPKAYLFAELGMLYEMQEVLGLAYKNYDNARHLLSSLKNNDLTARVEIHISQIHRKYRNFDASLRSCDSALQLSNDAKLVSLAHYSRSWTLLDQGNIPEAEREINIALEKAPDSLNAEVVILQAEILNRKGEPQQALEVATESFIFNSNPQKKSEAYLVRALSYYQLAKNPRSMRLDQSLTAYGLALVSDFLKNDPVWRAFILYNKGSIHVRLEQISNAQLCLEEASKCDYKNQPFGRDLLRFMLEPLKKEEAALPPAQILEQRIQQKQKELQALIAKKREEEDS